MKILWVKAGKLLPVDTGGKIRSYNILRWLAKQHEVTLLSYYGGRRDETYERDIQERFPGAVPLHTGAWDASAPERALFYLRKLPSPAPFAVTKHTAAAVKRHVSEWLQARRFDVAICDFLAASLNFPRQSATPTVLFQHNVESSLWQRQAQYDPNLVKRMVFKLEAAKMTRYENQTVARFDHVIAVSEVDKALMSAMTDPARISVVPTGVDVEQYQQAAGPSVTEPRVLFLGSMDWEANIDGVDYFCREIWPQIKTAVPDAKFSIVGRNPPPRIQRLASEDIEVTGWVASTIEPLRAAAAFVVPLRIGGGTRLKIYEAMAMRKAVVSTSIGAEGLDVKHGRDILLADEPADFAQQVIELLRNHSFRVAFEQAASETAARYNWPDITKRFEESLTQARRDARAQA
jgi:glycosyltransferase involved in cell wall biosynthesis